jgi:hypothetical protein
MKINCETCEFEYIGFPPPRCLLNCLHQNFRKWQQKETKGIENIIYQQKKYIEEYEKEISNIKELQKCLSWINDDKTIKISVSNYNGFSEENFYIYNSNYCNLESNIRKELCKYLEEKIKLSNNSKIELENKFINKA